MCRETTRFRQQIILIEHPEDLGRTTDGSSPASIFALQDLLDLCTETKANTVCFHQCPWGATSSKPTRMVSTLDLVDPSGGNKLFQGLPTFDRSGYYKGPLPKQCGHRRHVPLIRLENCSSAAKFHSAAAAAYPAGMCKWIADTIVRFCCKPKGGVLLATKPDVSPPLPRLPLPISGAISLEDLPFLSHVVDPRVEVSSDEEEPGFKIFSNSDGTPVSAGPAVTRQRMKTSTIRCDPTVVMFHGDTLGCIMPESFRILPSSFHFARGPCASSAMYRTCRYLNDWRVLSLFSLASRWAHFGLWRHSVETLRGNTHSERFVFSGNPPGALVLVRAVLCDRPFL